MHDRTWHGIRNRFGTRHVRTSRTRVQVPKTSGQPSFARPPAPGWQSLGAARCGIRVMPVGHQRATGFGTSARRTHRSSLRDKLVLARFAVKGGNNLANLSRPKNPVPAFGCLPKHGTNTLLKHDAQTGNVDGITILAPRMGLSS